jgi:hypothetical protein
MHMQWIIRKTNSEKMWRSDNTDDLCEIWTTEFNRPSLQDGETLKVEFFKNENVFKIVHDFHTYNLFSITFPSNFEIRSIGT